MLALRPRMRAGFDRGSGMRGRDNSDFHTRTEICLLHSGPDRCILARKGGAPMHRIALLTMIALLSVSAGHSAAPAADWAINATAIEPSSCPHFCMCYFNAHPAAHHENGKTEHFCKFNNAYKVNKGHYGSTARADAQGWLRG